MQSILFTVALGFLAGCPGKDMEDGTGSSGTESSTGATTSGSGTGSSGTESSTGATTSGSGTDTVTGGAVAACECIDGDLFGESSYTCEVGPCEEVYAGCGDGTGGGSTGGGSTGGGDTDTDTDGGGCEPAFAEANLTCVLDLLIAGKPGLVQWYYSPDQGYSQQGGFLQVQPDREGLTRTWEVVDLSMQDSAAGVVPLKTAAYFQGCKDMATPGQRFWCMTQWSEQQPTAQCDGPGDGSDV